MLETIKAQISQHYSLDEQKWIFFSCFDNNNSLISSHGVLVTNKSLWTVTDMIYHGIIEPQKEQISHIICDVVLDTQMLNTMDEISKINITTHWLSISTIDYTKSGVILPNTAGIWSLSQMIQVVKEKNNIEGNVVMYAFESARISIKGNV